MHWNHWITFASRCKSHGTTEECCVCVIAGIWRRSIAQELTYYLCQGKLRIPFWKQSCNLIRPRNVCTEVLQYFICKKGKVTSKKVISFFLSVLSGHKIGFKLTLFSTPIAVKSINKKEAIGYYFLTQLSAFLIIKLLYYKLEENTLIWIRKKSWPRKMHKNLLFLQTFFVEIDLKSFAIRSI